MSQSYYEINVAKNNSHYFATAERSILTKEKALEVFKDFKKRFPKKEGFSVSVSYYHCSGFMLNTEKDIKKFDPYADDKQE